MENGFYADTVRLQQHSENMREQKRTAEQLYERLRTAYEIAAPADSYIYEQLAQQAYKLVRYFDEMSKKVEDMRVQLEQLSLEINAMFRA